MSCLRTFIQRNLVRGLTHPNFRRLVRTRARLLRLLRGAPARVHYFHDAGDPYSHLCARLLPELAARYAIELVPLLVGPPADSAAPDRDRLQAWSRRDAGLLAQAHGLAAASCAQAASAADTQMAQTACAASLQSGRFMAQAAAISDALWQGDSAALRAAAGATPPQAVQAALSAGMALRQRLGHYLGATFHFGGEWYWGPDRLHYLELRLRHEGLCPNASLAPLVPALEPVLAPRSAPTRRAQLHFFCSFRSPYTAIAVQRVRQLASHHGAEVKLRFVLPMVMRGLPVPREKRLYIVTDAAREAQRAGVPFGNSVDPVGPPVERGYAVLNRAISAGRGIEFAESFLQGVWADGLDAGRDDHLRRIAARAGLDAGFVSDALRDESWREVASANRAELLSLDLWGVPSFRVDDGPGYWGQDRLWRVERDLIAATQG